MDNSTVFSITTAKSSYMCNPVENFTYEITNTKTSEVMGKIVICSKFISCTSNKSSEGMYMILHTDNNIRTENEFLKYFKICVAAIEEYLKAIA